MKTAWPIARVAGIPIRIHVSFLLIVGWMAWLGWGEGGWRTGLSAAGLIVALFGCVVLHELGHSLVAMAFGAKVRSVTLYPIGGVAGLESVPRGAGRELLMAAAGPAVNVLIAGGLALVRGGFPDWSNAAAFPGTAAEFLDALIRANIVLAVFNLLPAFPMDGGRVLRSFLALFLPYPRATSLAAAIGQALAVGLLLLGLAIGNPFLSVIAVFVFLGAGREEQIVKVRSVLEGVRAADVMLTDFVCVKPDDPVARCADEAAARNQRHFPVETDGRIVGLVPHDLWTQAIAVKGRDALVQDIMQKIFVSVDAQAPMDRLYGELSLLKQAFFPVLRDGRAVGLLTREAMADCLRKAEMPTNGVSPSYSAPADRISRFTIDLG